MKRVVNDKIFWNTEGTFLKTSGSMGCSKVIFHTWSQHINSASSVIKNTNLSDKSISLLSLPLNHISGLAILIRSWYSGGKYILPPIGWEPAWARKKGVTHISLVGTQLFRFMKNKENILALRSMHAILLGGSSISCFLIKKAFLEKLPIIVTYGSTETASQVTATFLGDTLKHLYTSGRCLINNKINIQNKEIFIHSKNIGLNILENKISTNCINKLSIATGDIGQINSDGYLCVLGRKDNCFISGGENVYPEEIERALLSNPLVENALVLSRENTEYGQCSVVFVKTESDLRAVRDVLKSNLDGFKIPKHWYYWPKNLEAEQKPNRKFFLEYLNKYCK